MKVKRMLLIVALMCALASSSVRAGDMVIPFAPDSPQPTAPDASEPDAAKATEEQEPSLSSALLEAWVTVVLRLRLTS